MLAVIDFLERHGFDEVDDRSYANDKCNVVFREDYYEVANNNGYAAYSHDLNIYWLIGFLLYNGYIDKYER